MTTEQATSVMILAFIMSLGTSCIMYANFGLIIALGSLFLSWPIYLLILALFYKIIQS